MNVQRILIWTLNSCHSPFFAILDRWYTIPSLMECFKDSSFNKRTCEEEIPLNKVRKI